MNKTAQSQNFTLALGSGVLASIVLAALWGAITYITHYQIGWMAIGVGYCIGMVIQYVGKGSSIQFALLGAALSLLTCLAGNIIMCCMQIASMHNMPVFDVLKQVDFEVALTLLKENTVAMDLLFYGLAIYEGFKFSVTEDQAQPSALYTT